MTKISPERNKALVLEAFETFFNKSATTPPPSGSGSRATSSTALMSG
jgi:hypothetical protein